MKIRRFEILSVEIPLKLSVEHALAERKVYDKSEVIEFY